MSDKIKIKFICGTNTLEYEFNSGINLLSAMIESGFAEKHKVNAVCAGKGTCGKCRVKVLGDACLTYVSEITEQEKKLLGSDAVNNGFRLACMTKALGNTELILDSDSSESADIAVSGEHGFEYPHNPISSGYGFAVDIGTTTAAVYLVNLTSGKTVGTRAFMNPQSIAGADVISRIQYTIENPDGVEYLKKLISSAISKAVSELSSEAGISKDDITCAVIAGNTVMEHFLAGIDARSISVAPFDAPSLFGEYFSPDEFGFSDCVSSDAKIYLAPCVASYVGGDLTAGAVAAGLRYTNGSYLFIDIGTNGEMGLLHNGKITFCATAAGPAFEGAHIECGMSGITGAVKAVTLNSDNTVDVSVIGDTAPTGICGSGIIDAAAVFLKLGLIDETGCILSTDEVDESLHIFTDEDGEKLYFGKDKSVYTNAVYLTGEDIREIQLAKSAVSAGIATLLNNSKITSDEIDGVLLAGGFGSKINPDSACEIGLIPREFSGKIKALGNTSGTGAVMMLLSETALRDSEKVAKESEYLELSCNSFFMEEFVEHMMF